MNRQIETEEKCILMQEKLQDEGWMMEPAGQTRYNNYDGLFDLYVRKQELTKLFGTTDGTGNDTESHFERYKSLKNLRTDDEALVIAYSCTADAAVDKVGRQILSWEFSVVRDQTLSEYILIAKTKKRITLEYALARILEDLQYKPKDRDSVVEYRSRGEVDPNTGKRKETIYKTKCEAEKNSKANYRKTQKVRERYNMQGIKIVLLCNGGKEALSALDQSGKYNKNILKHCKDVQGGIVSERPISIYPKQVSKKRPSNNHTYIYSLKVTIADTMCHSPAKHQLFADLGASIGLLPFELTQAEENNKKQLLETDPQRFMEYVAKNNIIMLCYLAAIYGYNRMPPMTITSVATSNIKMSCMSYLACDTDEAFDRKYRGMIKKSHGLEYDKRTDKYKSNKSLDPVSFEAEQVQMFASHAYHGGYNTCSTVGYYDNITSDFDLKSAYPTAMCLVADINWDDPIKKTIAYRELTLSDFEEDGKLNPVMSIVACVHFTFPNDVFFPCIPVEVDGIPIYPLTSGDDNDVYACGPELYLALQLGAKVFVKQGYVLNTLMINKNPSYSLRESIHLLVSERNLAKKEHGKGSLIEIILKMNVNTIYGKLSQGIREKKTWSAIDGQMHTVDKSQLTSPVTAAMTTSIVRAVLFAVQNECRVQGYTTYSVTTDGFISDCTMQQLSSMDLYGYTRVLQDVRHYLTDNQDSGIWEIKHQQDDLLNATTRCNVSLHTKTDKKNKTDVEYEGVCAHGSARSPHKADSFEDRKWLYKSILDRDDRVDYNTNTHTSYRDLSFGSDYVETNVKRQISLDHDLKRKPIRESIHDVEVIMDNKTYIIANFETEPYASLEEFLKYRAVKKNVKVLRTKEDWDKYYHKLLCQGNGNKIRDLDWAILNSCIMAYRAGLVDIPMLDTLTGQARFDWINQYNESSSKSFSANDWKNAGRAERQRKMLLYELIEEKLKDMQMDQKTNDEKRAS